MQAYLLTYSKNIVHKSEQIQNTAIRFALGFRNSTPINILRAESKLPITAERTKFLGYTYLTKILSNKNLSSNITN